MVLLFFYQPLEALIVHDSAPHTALYTPYHCFDEYSSDRLLFNVLVVNSFVVVNNARLAIFRNIECIIIHSYYTRVLIFAS